MHSESIYPLILALLIISAIIITPIMIIIGGKKAREQEQKRIDDFNKDRESLSPEAFYERYFKYKGISKEVVIEIRKIIENIFDFDLSGLKDTDELFKDLKFLFDSDSMADTELIIMIEEKFDIKITDADAQEIKTVNDLVMLVDKKVKASDN